MDDFAGYNAVGEFSMSLVRRVPRSPCAQLPHLQLLIEIKWRPYRPRGAAGAPEHREFHRERHRHPYTSCRQLA
jgi:hypothetical protein